MTATTTARTVDNKGRHLYVGTIPLAANTRVLKGTIVQRDANGRGVAGADGNGLPAVGIAAATYDNTTGSEPGGGAGALDAQIYFGVYGMAGEIGALPTVGSRCYVVDNQTVSTTAQSATGDLRGYAGVCVEVRDSKYWVQFGPEEAAGVSSGVVTIESDFAYDDADVAVAATSMTRNLVVDLPVGAVVLGAEANTSADWTDGSTGTFALNLGDGTDADEYAADLGNIDGGASRVGAAVMLALNAEGDIVATISGSVNLSTLTGGATTVRVFVALP